MKKLTQEKVKEIKKDFPIFNTAKGKKLVYLDNGATTQKPADVINALQKFFSESNANIHRGVYSLSQKATGLYENARKTVAGFINAGEDEIIFTKGATESLNALAYTIRSLITDKDKDEIVLTMMEHHANLIPWQQLAKRTGMKIRFVNIKKDFTLDMDDAKKKITEKTAIVSVVHVSNAIGTINDVKTFCALAKKKGA